MIAMRHEKIQLVNDLSRLINASNNLFLVTYKGLKVADFDDLRTKLAEVDSECHVVPNRLFLRAAAECGLDSLAEYQLKGDSALVTGGSDAAAVAKLIRKFSDAHGALKVKIGCMDGNLLEPEDVEALAKLPGREVLLAQLLGVLQGPSRQLAGVLYNRIASVVYVLNAYQQSKQ